MAAIIAEQAGMKLIDQLPCGLAKSPQRAISCCQKPWAVGWSGTGPNALPTCRSNIGKCDSNRPSSTQ